VPSKAVPVLVALLFVGGCNAAPKDIYTADGRRGHVLDCSPKREIASRALAASGSDRAPFRGAAENMPPPQPDWGKCFAQAGNLCGAQGYDTLERNPSGTMVVQCKGQ
jgi:hypothetical protein